MTDREVNFRGEIMGYFDFTCRHTDLRATNSYTHTKKETDKNRGRGVDFGGEIMGYFQITQLNKLVLQFTVYKNHTKVTVYKNQHECT